MKVGIVGLGKLGLPVAYAMASRGVEVYGFDPHVQSPPADLSHEALLGLAVAEAGDSVRFCRTVGEVVQACDVVFVAVQTPHGEAFEGITPLPHERADFDYSFLKAAVEEIDNAADRDITLAIISTVLPGTMAREIVPMLGRCSLVYNPSFIAMGTTIPDFLNPEFVLLGGNDFPALGRVERVYRELGIDSTFVTSVENAELIKVAYNTFIGLKLAFANTLLEVCHKTPGTDVDQVTDALKLAHRRLISGAYLEGGMGDGGACHPRDNIALSWLARRLDLSFDLFEAAMAQREGQAEWLVELMEAHDLPMGILGVAYKPSSRITTGSHALLVKSLLEEYGHPVDVWDPHVHNDVRPTEPHVFLVGCKHPEFPSWVLPEGSVVVDPWRYMPDQQGVEVVRVGQWVPAHTDISRSTSQPQAA